MNLGKVEVRNPMVLNRVQDAWSNIDQFLKNPQDDLELNLDRLKRAQQFITEALDILEPKPITVTASTRTPMNTMGIKKLDFFGCPIDGGAK